MWSPSNWRRRRSESESQSAWLSWRLQSFSRYRIEPTGGASLEYLIKQSPLETGALEIQYIEEYFGEFPRKKTAQEIANRLNDREYLILMAEAPLPDDPGLVVPVSY